VNLTFDGVHVVRRAWSFLLLRRDLLCHCHLFSLRNDVVRVDSESFFPVSLGRILAWVN